MDGSRFTKLKKILCLWALWSVSTGLAALTDARIENIRILPHQGSTRVILDLDQKASYQLLGPSPSRKLTLSLDGAQIKPGLQAKLARLPLQATGLQTLKLKTYGRRAELNILLRRPQSSSIQTLKPSGRFKHRIIIDFDKQQKKMDPVVSRLKVPRSETRRIPLKSIQPRQFVIAIDAGHGGRDPGAIGGRGTQEKVVALAVAKGLARLINQEAQFRAVLTRTGDYFLSLPQRVEIARQHKADLFISIHADAFHNRQAQGASIFTLSDHGATNAAARWLAERENNSDLIGGLQLKGKNKLLDSVLLDLSQVASLRASTEAADHILKAMRLVVPLHRERVDQAGFAVLKAPDIPSLLIETGFLTNVHSEARLNNPLHQQALAQAVLNGVRAYFDGKLPGTTLANNELNAKSNTSLARLPRESNRGRRGR